MKTIIPALALLCSIGCATPYQASGFAGGFTETQVAEDAFEVAFAGNGYSNRQRTVDFCLLRCAELASSHSFSYFIILGADQGTNTSYYSTGSVSGSSYSGTTIPINKPSSRNTIKCFKEKPDVQGIVYEVDFVMGSIRGKYGIDGE